MDMLQKSLLACIALLPLVAGDALAQSPFSTVPTFDLNSNLLDSSRCVLILTDTHPAPYAPGQERYFIQLTRNNDSFQLTDAQPGTEWDTCSGTFDARTGLYSTSIYFGSNLYVGPPLEIHSYWNPASQYLNVSALTGKAEVTLKLSDNNTFELLNYRFINDYLTDALFVAEGESRHLPLPAPLQGKTLQIVANDGTDTIDFIQQQASELIVSPTANDFGYYNVRLLWDDQVEYLSIVVTRSTAGAAVESDAIDIAEFDPARTQAIPVRVITFDPSVFPDSAPLRLAGTRYGNNQLSDDLNAQYGWNLDTSSFESYCGPLPDGYNKQGWAHGANDCMVATLMERVNERYAVYSNIGIRFSLAEVIESDYAGFDMTRPSRELLAELAVSELAKTGYINIFYLPYVECCQGSTYLNGDINAKHGISIVRANQLDLDYNATITAHEIGHALGVPHLTAKSTYVPMSNPGISLEIPSFLDIQAKEGCEYLNIMSNFTDGCDGPYTFDTPIHGELIRKILARQLFEWGLTQQKIKL